MIFLLFNLPGRNRVHRHTHTKKNQQKTTHHYHRINNIPSYRFTRKLKLKNYGDSSDLQTHPQIRPWERIRTT